MMLLDGARTKKDIVFILQAITALACERAIEYRKAVVVRRKVGRQAAYHYYRLTLRPVYFDQVAVENHWEAAAAGSRAFN